MLWCVLDLSFAFTNPICILRYYNNISAKYNNIIIGGDCCGMYIKKMPCRCASSTLIIVIYDSNTYTCNRWDVQSKITPQTSFYELQLFFNLYPPISVYLSIPTYAIYTFHANCLLFPRYVRNTHIAMDVLFNIYKNSNVL